MLVPAVLQGDLPTDFVHSGVAETAGAAGTNWQSDVRILNPGSAVAEVHVRLLGRTESETSSVAAGHVLALDQVLSRLGLPDGTAGALSVISDRPLISQARTANRSATGTFATGIAARRKWIDDIAAGRRGHLVVDDDQHHRVNIGLLGGHQGGRGVLTLLNSQGVLVAQRAFELQADQWRQSSLETWLGAKAGPSHRLEIAVESGSTSAYAARIDEANGDTTLVLPMASPLDPDGLIGRVLAGYQGWFGAPGDGSEFDRWWHWFDDGVAGEGRWTVDFLPDVSEMAPEERFSTALVSADGAPIELYSNWHPATVSRHFSWLAEADMDGVLLQRFVRDLDDPKLRSFRDRVLANVENGAETHGRLFTVMYDIAGAAGEGLGDRIWSDWVDLVDQGHVESPAWLRHRSAPVVGLWGLAFDSTFAQPADIAALVERFHNGPERYRASVIGGIPGGWRTLVGQADPNPEWPAVIHSLDVASPWHVGWSWDTGSHDAVWNGIAADDRAALEPYGVDYLPVVFPGFSWHNLTGRPSNWIARDGGRFLWRQMANAAEGGMIYVAMFDEVDEGTAIFKMVESDSELPPNSDLLSLEVDGFNLPADWYLRVCAGGARMLRGQIPISRDLPSLPLGDGK